MPSSTPYLGTNPTTGAVARFSLSATASSGAPQKQGVLKHTDVTFEQCAGFYSPKQETVTYPENVRIVDYRSDAFSKPSWQMRRKMYEAEVGDDIFGEDPIVIALELKGAKMLGKEAALFVPSGTMSNLLALVSHSHMRGCEIIVGDNSYVIVWDPTGAAQASTTLPQYRPSCFYPSYNKNSSGLENQNYDCQDHVVQSILQPSVPSMVPTNVVDPVITKIAGVQLRTVSNKPDGSFDIKEMIKKVRDRNDLSQLKTTLVCIENTHNTCGGRVLPLSWIRELSVVLKDLNIPLHMDGARFFNAVVKSAMPPQVMAEGCDTISICLNKGLGAPMGSLLIGSEETIFKARVLRNALGGSMRKMGLVAAAGIYALDNMVDRLQEDHIHTYNIAKAIHEMNSEIVSVDLDTVETNILLIKLAPSKVTANAFCKRLALVTDEEMKEEEPASVKMFPSIDCTARLVVSCNNSPKDERVTIKKLQRVIWEYENGIFLV